MRIRSALRVAASVLFLAAGCEPATRQVEQELRKEPRVVWGKPVRGLQAGLMDDGQVYEYGKPVNIGVHLKNVGRKKLKVEGIGSPSPMWRIEFRGQGRRFALVRKSLMPLPMAAAATLRSGQEHQASLTAGGPDYVFLHVGTGAQVKPKTTRWPPPGKYTVIAMFDGFEEDKVQTGEIVVEVRPGRK
jgi:hypothetical protein